MDIKKINQEIKIYYENLKQETNNKFNDIKGKKKEDLDNYPVVIKHVNRY
jgi:hypothetical protein